MERILQRKNKGFPEFFGDPQDYEAMLYDQDHPFYRGRKEAEA